MSRYRLTFSVSLIYGSIVNTTIPNIAELMFNLNYSLHHQPLPKQPLSSSQPLLQPMFQPLPPLPNQLLSAQYNSWLPNAVFLFSVSLLVSLLARLFATLFLAGVHALADATVNVTARKTANKLASVFYFVKDLFSYLVTSNFILIQVQFQHYCFSSSFLLANKPILAVNNQYAFLKVNGLVKFYFSLIYRLTGFLIV